MKLKYFVLFFLAVSVQSKIRLSKKARKLSTQTNQKVDQNQS